MQFIQWPRDDIAEPILQNCVSDARQTAFSSNVPTCYERADMVNGKWLHTFVNGEFVVSHTVEVCDTIYDIRVSVGDCCPPPPSFYSIEIGNNTVITTADPEFNNIFTYKCPIPVLALFYQNVKIKAHFPNGTDLLAQESPVYFHTTCGIYPNEFRQELAKSIHKIPIEDRIFRISGGLSGFE